MSQLEKRILTYFRLHLTKGNMTEDDKVIWWKIKKICYLCVQASLSIVVITINKKDTEVLNRLVAQASSAIRLESSFGSYCQSDFSYLVVAPACRQKINLYYQQINKLPLILDSKEILSNQPYRQLYFLSTFRELIVESIIKKQHLLLWTKHVNQLHV